MSELCVAFNISFLDNILRLIQISFNFFHTQQVLQAINILSDNCHHVLVNEYEKKVITLYRYLRYCLLTIHCVNIAGDFAIIYLQRDLCNNITTDSSGDNTVLTFIIRPILLFLPGCKAMTSFGETANRSQTQNTRLYLYKKTKNLAFTYSHCHPNKCILNNAPLSNFCKC